MNEKTLALSIANLALEKQAHDLEIINVSEFVEYADYIIVCGGRSERQVRAIAESIEVGMKKRGLLALGVEGRSKGQWVLMDYDAVIVHIFHEHARAYYDIEGLWLEARRLPVSEAAGELQEEPERAEGRCASGS